MKKGVISFIELVIVGVILFTSFALFFNKKVQSSNYGYIKTKLVGYDFLFSAFGYNNNIYKSYVSGRIEDVYDNEIRKYWSFSSYYVFLDGIVPYNIQVACNCSNKILTELNNLFSEPITINGRKVSITFVYSDVPHKGNLKESISPGDLLLVWGCMDDSVDVDRLKGYLLSGKGIINICDPDSTTLARNVYQDIFGIEGSSASLPTNDVNITKPNSAYEFTYQPKKYFFEINLQPTFGDTKNWIYTFKNFLTSSVRVKPTSNFYNRSIVYVQGIEIAGATANYFGKGGIAIWCANFTRMYSNLQDIQADDKKFLLSLILAATDKRGLPDIIYRVKGVPVYYFDVVGDDVFEPYEAVFSLYL